MITNEREYRITKSRLSRMGEAVAGFDMAEAARATGSEVLARAELDALRSEVEVLSAEVEAYEALKSGKVRVLTAENLGELPSILVRARIARGLSQRELGERLGMKEQQIQRYESEGYASASLRRLMEVAEALELNITASSAVGA